LGNTIKIELEEKSKKDSGDSTIVCNMDQLNFPDDEADEVSTPVSERTQ
jgi:hypothetical protein